MIFNLCLVFNVDHGALRVRALLAAGHANVGALQVVQRHGVGHVRAQRRADLVQRELGGVLELVVPQPESRVQHSGQNGHQLLLLLGQDVRLEVLAQKVRHVSQGGLKVSLGAQGFG